MQGLFELCRLTVKDSTLFADVPQHRTHLRPEISLTQFKQKQERREKAQELPEGIYKSETPGSSLPNQRLSLTPTFRHCNAFSVSGDLPVCGREMREVCVNAGKLLESRNILESISPVPRALFIYGEKRDRSRVLLCRAVEPARARCTLENST